MKVDPNKHCTKFSENRLWAVVHDLVAHPLMALTLYSDFSVRLHNYTSEKAWSRGVSIV